jgi:hypothetical protein
MCPMTPIALSINFGLLGKQKNPASPIIKQTRLFDETC